MIYFIEVTAVYLFVFGVFIAIISYPEWKKKKHN